MERPIKGGYILISLGLIALSTSYSGSIDYDRISRTKKHIVLTGIKVGDTVMPDICVKPVYGNGTITFEDVYGYDVVISSNNSVSVSEHKNLVIDGDITATGKITGGEIVENMSGYSFERVEENTELTILYAGVVKNGNKITFVIFGKYNRPAVNPKINPYLGKFIMPMEVASKIQPWSGFFVDSKNIPFFASASTISNKVVGTEKRDATSIQFVAYGTHTLTEATDYMFRVEETFLLSENLVSE